MRIVFDASTLILLAKADILREALDIATAIIPPAVRGEALAKSSPDAELVKLLIREKKIEVQRVSKKASGKIMGDFNLHKGEAEALVLAATLKLPLAVDDRLAIKACKVLGIPFVTAIHFLVSLAAKGAIKQPLVLEKITKLSRLGRYKAQIIENATRLIKGGCQ